MVNHEGLALRGALVHFVRAKAAIEATFDLVGAPAIVESVIKGLQSREGTCLNGDEYSVHGIGYTVVLPRGGQVHIDGSSDGDVFSTYDVIFFLETSGSKTVPNVALLEAEFEKLVESGDIRRAAKYKYLLPGDLFVGLFEEVRDDEL